MIFRSHRSDNNGRTPGQRIPSRGSHIPDCVRSRFSVMNETHATESWFM